MSDSENNAENFQDRFQRMLWNILENMPDEQLSEMLGMDRLTKHSRSILAGELERRKAKNKTDDNS